ncbi:MAG: hypothetical protein R3359_01345, partial [Marinirhabdus sp.]|nr:hypothetical protein [Marinirhabdus sp.]
MNAILRIVTFLLFPIVTLAQVGIGNTNPQAALDISATNAATPSNTDGILIPRIDDFPASNPTAAQDGMLVFATGNGTPSKGFYFWNNATTSWDSFSGASDADWFVNPGTSTPTNIADNIYTQGNVEIDQGQLTIDAVDDLGGGFNFYKTISTSTAFTLRNFDVNTTINGSTSSWNFETTYLGTGSGSRTAFVNIFGGTGAGSETGTRNTFSNNSSIAMAGVVNNFNNSSTGSKTGFYNILNGQAQNGLVYGLRNRITGGTGTIYGTFTDISGGSGTQRGSYIALAGGTGPRYGLQVQLTGTGGNTDYGLYSDVEDVSNGYAAYLRGRTSLGNTSSNRYLMPASDGANGQVMTTDGSGNVTFQDVSGGAERIDDLIDGKSDNDGSNDGSSVFLGLNAGQNDDSSDNQNVAVGYNTLIANTTGDSNSAFGYISLNSNTTGSANVALGWGSLNSANSNSNTAVGYLSAAGITDGNANTAIGRNSLISNTTGDNNTALGSFSGWLARGTGNVFLGAFAGASEVSIDNKLFIENSDADANSALVYGDFGADNSTVGNVLRTNAQFQIGNPSLTGYAFPTTDGTNGQILTTDGNGAITFQNAASEDADWYGEGTTDAPSSINDDIFTQGNVAIGKNTADYALDIEASGATANPILTRMVDNNTGTGDHIGLQQSMNGSHNELVKGIETYITNTGSGLHTAFTGSVQNGSGNQVGMRNTLRGSAGENTIYSGSILNSGAASTSIQRGVSIDVQQPSSQITYGQLNTLNANGAGATGRKYGLYNLIDGGTGSHFGVYNDVRGILNNTKYGTYNIFGIGTTNTGGVLYGTYNDFGNSITSTHSKYGTYTIIPATLLGTHYGSYSDVQNPTGYAAYFIGRTSLGNTASNRYLMPAADGTAGQVMTTNGAGILTFQDVIGDGTGTDDQSIDTFNFNTSTNVLTLEIENDGVAPQTVDLSSLSNSVTANNGLTNVGNTIQLGGTLNQLTTVTQNTHSLIFNLNSTGDFSVLDSGTSAFIVEDSGDVGISVANPIYKLDIAETGATDLRAVNITKTDNSAASTFGTYITKTASGTGRSHAQFNLATSTGTGYSYGVYNETNGVGTGQKYGVFNEINSAAAGNQYGVRNWMRGNTSANQFGMFNNMDSNASGDVYGLYNGMRNTGGSSQVRGIHNEFSTAGNVAELTGLRNQMSNGTPGAGSMNGVYNDFSNANNGNYIGSRTEFTAAATGTGNKYGTYNLISAAAGGTHYGTYNSVSTTNGWAGYFIGRNYISDRLSIGEIDNVAASLNISTNSTGSVSHIELEEVGAGDGARIRFTNAAETTNNWVLYGRADDTPADGRFNIFHPGTGNIMVATGDGAVGIMRTPATNTFEVNGTASKSAAGDWLANS